MSTERCSSLRTMASTAVRCGSPTARRGERSWSRTAIAGTALVGGASNPSYLTDVDGSLFFTAESYDYGRELWKSDGTTGGTVLVKDINRYCHYGHYCYTYGSDPNGLTVVAGTLFFAAE